MINHVTQIISVAMMFLDAATTTMIKSYAQSHSLVIFPASKEERR